MTLPLFQLIISMIFLTTAALIPSSAAAASATPVTNGTGGADPCPYDIDGASRMVPSECYANATGSTAAATSCCWFVTAAYIYAAAAHANVSGVAFLPPSVAVSCSNNFTTTLLRRGLARPALLSPNGSCSLSSDSPSLAAGQRPCLYSRVSNLLSAAPTQISNASRFCSSSSVPDLSSDQSACSTCQNTIINATFALLDSSKSKDYVACGMAATIGMWSRSYPSLPRFRSFVLCVLQVLEDVSVLGIPSDSPSPAGSQHVINSRPTKSGHSQKTVIIAAASAAAGLVSVVGVAFLSIIIYRSRHRQWKSRRLTDGIATTSDGDKSNLANSAVAASPPLPTEGLYIFTKAELKQATNGFDGSLLLGQGGAGKVYLGKLPSGQHVAIKRIYREKKISEFYSEVGVLSKLRHKNLTTLVGYCLDDHDNHVLVYEYMPGGNLSRALFHGEMSWHRRLRVAVDVAQGLVYLHEFPGGAVVHRDVKPTNVLLSESGVAKLSDFGVSRIMASDATHLSTEVRGTMGYMDPESFSLGQVCEYADVYSFGVVLLELVTGQRAVVPTPSGGAESIVQTARCAMMDQLGGGGNGFMAVESVVDPRLGPYWDRPTVGTVFRVAYRCVQPYKTERPKMAEVLLELKSALTDLEARDGDTTASEPSTEETSLSRTSTPSALLSTPST